MQFKTNPRVVARCQNIECWLCEVRSNATRRNAKKDIKTSKFYCKRFLSTLSFEFAIKYGKFGKPSWKNLYKISTNQEYNDSTTLSRLCEDLGFSFPKSSEHSERICKPCGRSIRRTHAFYQLLKSAFLKEANQTTKDSGGDEEYLEARCKRGLPTTISPERRSSQKQRLEGLTSKDRKSLAFASTSASTSDQAKLNSADRCLSELSVNELLGHNSTQVKVVVLNPNQATETKSNFSEESKSLILNISRKKCTAANAVFKHPELKDKLLKHLQRVIEKEFSNYCKDSTKSILLGKSPKEVAEFRSKKLLKELQISCPYWSAAIMGASGVYNTADDTAVKINALALASAVVARARNHKMSALAYRMSTILFHSCAKSEDISRMNKLGVCMSPESTVEFQRKMGENCQCKVLKWKSRIENNKMALLFLEEVQRRHAVHETSDATTVVDFTNNALREWKYFNKTIQKYCQDLLSSISGNDMVTIQTVSAAINHLKTTPVPEYN